MGDEAKVSTEMREPTAVLIVGAGPTGLTLACELARRKVPFRIIETVPSSQPGSRGKGLQPRTLEVFDNLGLVDRVLAHGRMAMPIRSTASDGTVTTRGAEPSQFRPDIPYAASLITPEWRVEEALRLRLAELGGSVEFGTALDSFQQMEGAVSAVVTRDDKREPVTADWLVGCDGGHSLVRKQAGIAFEGETLEEVRMIVADVQVDGLDRDAWHMWSHEEGLVSLCPLPSTDLFQFQASIAAGQNPELSLGNMQAILDRRSRRTDVHLHEPEWRSLWRANIRLADRYREGCVFLAGDAAHIHSPAGGQGMNTGIQDAQNLGWKLAAVVNGAAPASLLDSYEAERRPVAVSVLSLSNARLKEATETKAIPTRRDSRTMQLDISYRDSALTRDDREGTTRLRAGDRAPDAPVLATSAGQRRLFDLMRGSHFTLLNFCPDAIAVERMPFEVKTFHVVRHPKGNDEIGDTKGYVVQAYQAATSSLVLIRPDGYIALISDVGDISVVSAYFAAISQRSNSQSLPSESQVGEASCRRLGKET